MRRLGAILLAVAALGLSAVSGAKLERLSADRGKGAGLLYLPNGKALRIASLGQAPVLADLLYLWAIQFYADYDREDRFRYVEHVFGDVIAELDPHYIDPYWLGALILTTEARDLDAGLRLLDKGFASNPDEWILPYLAGWECHHAKAYDRAASYFDLAASVPGAPPMVLRMRAGMYSRAGNLQEALRHWREVIVDPRSDAVSLAIAKRQIRDLTVKIDIEALEGVVERFRARNGRPPRSLEELVQRDYIGSVPRDPDGRSYVYDPETGRLTSSAGAVLGDF